MEQELSNLCPRIWTGWGAISGRTSCVNHGDKPIGHWQVMSLPSSRVPGRQGPTDGPFQATIRRDTAAEMGKRAATGSEHRPITTLWGHSKCTALLWLSSRVGMQLHRGLEDRREASLCDEPWSHHKAWLGTQRNTRSLSLYQVQQWDLLPYHARGVLLFVKNTLSPVTISDCSWSSWGKTSRTSKQSILKEISLECSLKGLRLKLKPQ